MLFTDFYAMEPVAPIGNTMQAYFAANRNKIREPLFSLLDSAKKKVLVAMYWITEYVIVDKLISLKQKGIDVQIIFDESSLRSTELMNKLLNNNIVPIIFPSETEGIGKMHNKFVVVDDTAVLTGSANFTETAFNPASHYFNYENIVILYSKEIAQKFRANFLDIEDATFELYIEIIASSPPDQLSEWITRLVPILYQNKSHLQGALTVFLRTNKPAEKKRLERFFGEEQATPEQKAFLKHRGVSTRDMSEKEATELIGRIYQPKKSEEQATPRQKEFLKRHRISTEGMSWQEAYRQIGRIKRQKSAAPRYIPY